MARWRTQPPRSITLIVCEGGTELKYLAVLCNRLGLRPTEVIHAENTEGSAPISVVACAERRAKERGGYDHIFCVCDRDLHESFERAHAPQGLSVVMHFESPAGQLPVSRQKPTE